MKGRIEMSDWPRLDPITQRELCETCWNHVHHRDDEEVKHECDCICRSEKTYAAIERKTASRNRREKKKLLRAQVEDPTNPLVAQNPSFKTKVKGKQPA